MPIRVIPQSDLSYALVLHDSNGDELPEADGEVLTSVILRQLLAPTADPITDVFIASHGWKGDVPAAIEQYDAWTAAMVAAEADRRRMLAICPGFRPLIVCLHWPSLPWGDETHEEEGRSALLGGGKGQEDVDYWARLIAGSPPARTAIERILAASAGDSPFPVVSPAMNAAYRALHGETLLGEGDAATAPGMNQGAFIPQDIVDDYVASVDGVVAGNSRKVPGRGDALRAALLSPLRQLSFWTMKDRARRFGEGAAHAFVREVQRVAPNARLHLMGHSFGCIVVSGAVAGRSGKFGLSRPVESLFLLQGALSLWAFAEANPYGSGRGYFAAIHAEDLVAGPVVTTRSTFDLAVGRYYPLGAGLRRQSLLDRRLRPNLPRYGGLGAFGIQGVPGAVDLPMCSVEEDYEFGAGMLVNLEASEIIRTGAGLSGAHSDILHPEIAHAFWAAVMARSANPRRASEMLGRRVPSFRETTLGMAFESLRSPGAPTDSRLNDELEMGAAPPSRTDERELAAAAATPMSGASYLPDGDGSHWLHARIEGDTPLSTEQWAVLSFDVGVSMNESATSHVKIPDSALFGLGETEASLTIQITTEDFEVLDCVRELHVSRIGECTTAARFAIRPLHSGPSELVALIHKGGNFVHQFRITFDVDSMSSAAVGMTGRGRRPDAAAPLLPRTIGLLLSPTASGYDCVVWGAVCGKAKLVLTAAQLAAAVDEVRRALDVIVQHRDETGRRVFQEELDIPERDQRLALAELAQTGASLFRQLFFGPGSARDSQHVGQFLRQTLSADGPPMTLQIVGDGAPVPWGLVYLGPTRTGAPLNWNAFLGLRHVIEHLPLQNELAVHASTIASDAPRLALAVFMNKSIDAQMNDRFVARQKQFFESLADERHRLQLQFGRNEDELTQTMTADDSTAQIVYIFCHASSAGLADAGGAEAAALYLDGDVAITLRKLKQQSDDMGLLGGKPLVFINACESAQLSPTFYDGFVPFLMSRGARGVIGTECRTPARFAEAWAQRFFPRFLDGEPLGQLFLGLRREFMCQHGNPLGLLYAVHCDGDTAIAPAARVGTSRPSGH